MKLGRRSIIFGIVSVFVLLVTSFVSVNFGAVICTLWIILLIIHYGTKCGLIFTLLTSVVIVFNYITIPTYRSFFPIMGIFTYLSISIGIGIPIDMMKKEQMNRIASEERLRRITDSIQDVIIQINKSGIINYISPSCFKVLGHPSEYYIGKSFFEEMNPEDYHHISKIIEDAFEEDLIYKGISAFEYRYLQKNGSYIWMESLGQVVSGDTISKSEMVINCRDITERKKTAEKISYLSYHDILTGLYNRAYFEEIQNKLIEEKILPVSIIVGDVNGLKLTNDVFGHYEGDQLLIKTANIFREVCRNKDVIVRWGGDEFAILLPETDEDTALKIINKIHSKCNELSSEPIKISIALGHGTMKNSEEEMRNIIKDAEEEMYRHKLMESSSARSNIISSLRETLLERSYETKEHTNRMIGIAQRFGRELSLSENELDELSLLAALHDIGKIAVKDDILVKPGKLTEA